MNVVELLRQQAHERPNQAAIIETVRGRDDCTTFADLERRGAQAARLLRQDGLRPGDAVLVFHPMSAELYVVLAALFRAGLVAMFVDPGAGFEHIDRCCALQSPQALIAGARAHLLCLRSAALRRIPRKYVVGWRLPGLRRWSAYQRLEPERDILSVAAETPALLTFTSGSTGAPKAAVRTHGFLAIQHRVFASSLALEAGDVDLATLPIVLLANLASGLTSVLPDADLRHPGSVRPGPILGQIERHAVSRCVASPAFFECLARGAAQAGRTFPRLERLFAGGAPVFPRHLAQMQQLAPGADVAAVYGSTEAEPIAHMRSKDISPADNEAMASGRGLLAGTPIREIQLRILRDQWGTPFGTLTAGQFAALGQAANGPGEIVVSGDHVLKAYLHGHGNDETKFHVDGVTWHRTGDAGYLDAAGRLWLLGRCAARIRDDRGDIYPLAVEAAANQEPTIRRCALARHNGRRVLVVELHGGAAWDPASLCSRLAWAAVDEIKICQRIPVDRRHNAKIDYPALERMLKRL